MATAAIALLLSASIKMQASGLKKLLAGNSAKPGTTYVHVRDKFALIIAVNRFQDASLPSNSDVLRNAKVLKDVLTSPSGKFAESHVQTLFSSHATISGIDDCVENWLEKKALPDDLIFIYICSIAAPGKNGHPLLFGYDSTISDKDNSAIDLPQWLHEIKERTQSKLILCALDTNPAPGSSGVDLKSLRKTGVAVFSATDGRQRSLYRGGSSLFTHHLCEAISLQLGSLSVQDACDYVSSQVAQDATQAFATTQTPQFAQSGDCLIASVPLGVAVKSSLPPQTFAIGHPMDRLALDHPDLIPPRPQVGPTLTFRARAKAQADNDWQGNRLAESPPPESKQDTGEPSTPSSAPDGKSELAAPTALGSAPDNKQEAGSRSASDSSAVDRQEAQRQPAPPPDHDKTPAKTPVDFASYLRKMRAAIQNRWAPPKSLTSRRVVATFAVYKDGHIDDPSIVESSGDPAVDRAALETLKAASPLPPLPQGAPEWVEIRFKFDWNIKPKQP